MFFKRTDNLTSNLTSYDFLKCITVLFMFADHIGAYFLMDETWWRVVGRLGFPAWFFLAGYSKDRGIKLNIWVGAAILTFGNIMFGEYIFPLNALASFICIRVFMAHWYQKYFSNWEILLYVTVALILLALPTNYIFEYGTLAFIFAMFGYAVRHQNDLGISSNIRKFFCIIIPFVTAFIQTDVFGFDLLQGLVCLGFMSCICFVLYHFKQAEYPDLTQKLPKPITKLIQIGGRYSLEIYVIHLMLIKIYLFCSDTEGRFEFFSPTMLPHF